MTDRKVELTGTDVKFQAMLDALDFVIGGGYDEADHFMDLRQQLAKQLGQPLLLICDYCGRDYDQNFENREYDHCKRCGEGQLKLGVSGPDEVVIETQSECPCSPNGKHDWNENVLSGDEAVEKECNYCDAALLKNGTVREKAK